MRTTLTLLAALACTLQLAASHAEPSAHTYDAPSAAAKTPRISNPQSAWKLAGAPDVRSSAVVIVDQQEGSLLYAKNSNKAMPIASITKLMTALVVLEAQQPLDELIKITKADRDTKHGSGSRLPVGTVLSRGDLLHLALMSSDNRAAHALARRYPGGLTACLRAMNAKATALGMKTARFADPTGLSSGNVASAADLVKLVVAAEQDPLIRAYSTQRNHTVTVGKYLLEFRNSNVLVTKPDWDVLVQKTGYTQDAGRCLVMMAKVNDRPIVMILLNSFGKYTRIADARRVRRWMEAGLVSDTQYANVSR